MNSKEVFPHLDQVSSSHQLVMFTQSTLESKLEEEGIDDPGITENDIRASLDAVLKEFDGFDEERVESIVARALADLQQRFQTNIFSIREFVAPIDAGDKAEDDYIAEITDTYQFPEHQLHFEYSDRWDVLPRYASKYERQKRSVRRKTRPVHDYNEGAHPNGFIAHAMYTLDHLDQQ